jgi:hypothetical protein
MKQILRKSEILTALMMLAPWSSAQLPGQPLNGNPVLTIAMYDYAHVPEKVLVSAEREVSRIFRHAGVKVAWVDCLSGLAIQSDPHCQHLLDHFHVEIKILPENLSAPLRYHTDTFGVAEVFEDRIGSVSYVFYDRVEAQTKNLELRAVLLGDLMVHELGHLLLGPHSHSLTGIMCAVWRGEELQNAAQGALLFTPTQSKLIRAKLSFRNAQEMAGLSSLTYAP